MREKKVEKYLQAKENVKLSLGTLKFVRGLHFFRMNWPLTSRDVVGGPWLVHTVDKPYKSKWLNDTFFKENEIEWGEERRKESVQSALKSPSRAYTKWLFQNNTNKLSVAFKSSEK